jgi:hypothetical protein
MLGILSMFEIIASISARNVDGNSEVSLPDLTILILCHGHCLLSLTNTLKITSDITNKRAESTLNSLSACFSPWFVTFTDYI